MSEQPVSELEQQKLRQLVFKLAEQSSNEYTPEEQELVAKVLIKIWGGFQQKLRQEGKDTRRTEDALTRLLGPGRSAPNDGEGEYGQG